LYYTPEKGWHKIDDSVVGLADNVRVLQTIGAWIAVDSDEDDKLDGYCLSSNFTSSLDDMPTFHIVMRLCQPVPRVFRVIAA
jgi:hypothetical protein